MPILFMISNLIFVGLLIRSSLKGESDTRFIIKLVACFHYLVLAFWAMMTLGLTAHHGWLILGLISAFFGDVALGLKHKARWAIKAGLLFFIVTQLSYITFFGITTLTIGLAIPLVIIAGFMADRIKKNKAYEFKDLGYGVLAYAVVMILMMSCALANAILTVSEATLLRALGAVFFVVSDATLLHYYFYTIKKNRTIVIYLIFYHVAQNLMALSLWFR